VISIFYVDFSEVRKKMKPKRFIYAKSLFLLIFICKKKKKNAKHICGRARVSFKKKERVSFDVLRNRELIIWCVFFSKNFT
jgi:hypothetical protein